MKKCLLLILIAFCGLAKAQLATKPKSPDLTFQKKFTVQIEGGTQGFGADVRYSFLPKLSARLGANFLPVTANNVFSVSGFDANNSLSAKFSNIHLLADYTPFKAQWFRLVGGAAYLIKGDGNVNIVPNGNYNFGNTTITADQIGQLNVDVTWKGVAPYLGFGFFKAVPSRMFNINLDLGTYYLSSPNTTVTGTKLLADNSSQQGQINENLKNYRFLPVLQLNFNFKIN